jgi:uncharacterized protein YukE
MPNGIYGVLDGIAADAQGLQTVSDQQAFLMNQLANTMDALPAAMSGAAATAMAGVGEQLRAAGNRMSATFADHSQKMHNNASIMQSSDDDNAHLISQVGSLTI